MAEKSIAHMNLGTAYANTRVAIDLLTTFTEDLLAQQGKLLTVEQRVSNRRRASFLVLHCKNAMNDIFSHTGSGSFNVNSPAQRIFRDLTMLSMHGFLDWDGARETWGRVSLGLPAAVPKI